MSGSDPGLSYEELQRELAGAIQINERNLEELVSLQMEIQEQRGKDLAFLREMLTVATKAFAPGNDYSSRNYLLKMIGDWVDQIEKDLNGELEKALNYDKKKRR